MTPQDARLTSHPPLFRAAFCAAAAECLMLALACGACARGPGASATGGASTEVARLQRSTVQLERQFELAGGKEFYLLLDPAASDLALMLRGAELRRFPVIGLQIGHPRVLWVGRRVPRRWEEAIWSKGELDPPRPTDRIVITVEAPGKGEEEPEPPPIPPIAEELYRVPPRFHIRFSGGLSVEIRPREADKNAGRFARLRVWWSARWGDVAAALGSSDYDVVRLRVVLKPKDAESLYRSLPPSVRLLVLSGAEKGPGPLFPAAPAAR